MNVGRKLIAIVITSATLVATPIAFGIYHYAKQKLLTKETTELILETKKQTTFANKIIRDYELGLTALSATFSKQLSAPVQMEESAIFDAMMRLDPDGALRSHHKSTANDVQAGVFIAPNNLLTAAQKSQHLRSKYMLDVFSNAITSSKGNIWLIATDKTEIISDTAYPNFVDEMQANTDYTQTPWFTLGDPSTNPARQLVWTPPLYDTPSKEWMISVIIPVDVQGRWIGNLGRDLSLKFVIQELIQSNKNYTGEHLFLLDAQGNFIQAGPWQTELEMHPKKMGKILANEPALANTFRTKLSTAPHALAHDVIMQGKKYLVIGSELKPIGWRYFKLVPIHEILSPIEKLFSTLASIVLLTALLVGLAISFAADRYIISRIKSLANALRKYSAGELDVRASVAGSDEVAIASREFDNMAGQLKSTLNAIPDILFDLDLQGRYYTVHTPDESLLVAPVSELLGETVPKMLPQKSAAIIMGALHEANEQGWSRGKQYQRKTPQGLLWFELSVAKKPNTDAQNPRFIVLSRDITKRKSYEMQLAESEFRWKFAVEGTGDGVWDWDMQTGKLDYSRSWRHLFGYEESDVLPVDYASWKDSIHPEDADDVGAVLESYISGKAEHYLVEYRLRCKDGRYKWILSRGLIVSRDNKGKPLRMIGTHSDITERKKTELDLRISAIAFEAQESMMVSDKNQVILRVNKAFTEITGYLPEEVLGKTALPLRSNLHDAEFYKAIWDSVNNSGAWKGEIYSMRKNGEVYPGILSITAVHGVDNSVTNYVATLVDITREKSTAEEIQYLAFYDPLTGLANRRLLLDRLSHALVSHARTRRDGALLFLDLDHFKSLNDTLGHDVGDMLLKEVAQRLSHCVREDDTVARLGGDEYVVLLENLSNKPMEAAAQAEAIGTKILEALNKPYILGTHEHHNTPSIGAALFSDHVESQEELLKHADIAMYQAKKAGRNTLRFYNPQMQESIHMRVELEKELRKAIEKQQLELYYQIQVSDAGHIIGAEALVRWLHPLRGLIPPLHFIPLAEETGLIIPIGQWVLETACTQIKNWQASAPTRDIVLSVNVSARQFRQADFAEQVKNAVLNANISPLLLKLELTESILLEDFDSTIATMNALKKIGVLFSLDDFGTGYSSLQYLKRLPLSQLKIDQTFVRDIFTDSSDKAIVTTIIAMAKSLDLEVIAEGVETEEQKQQLLALGCNSYQGFLFGKPLPIVPFEALLKEFADAHRAK